MFKWRRVKRPSTPSETLSIEANRLHDEAESMRPSGERDRVMREARQLDTAAHIDDWLDSPGLQPPKRPA